MHIPGELIIVGLIIIFLMTIMVTGTEYTIPMYVRSNFDDTCNKYLSLMEKDSGLNSSQKSMLRAEVAGLGITNISVSAPVHVNWGDEATLLVQGEYTFKTTQYPNIFKISTTKQITYKNSTRITGLD